MTIQTVTLKTTSSASSMREKDMKRSHRRLSGKARRLSSTRDVIEDSSQTYDLSDTEDKIAFIVSKLSHDELEVLARSSYEYLKSPAPSRRRVLAVQAVRRILGSKKGNVVATLTKVKKIIEFRWDAKVDELVTAFDDDTKSQSAAKKLQSQLATKKFHVQGFDKDGRSTLYFIPRNVVDHDLDSAIYSIERAIACSRSFDKKINCVVDFTKFPISNAPPLEIGKQFLTTLRLIYAGQINRIFLVNVPFTFTLLWNVFAPFVGTDTRDKITIIKDTQNEKEELMLSLYDRNELPNWAVPGGQKNRSLDVDQYLFVLPFGSPFDSQ